MSDPRLNQKRDQLVAGAHSMPTSVIVRFQRVPFPNGASDPPVFRGGVGWLWSQFQRQHPSAVGLIGDGLGHSLNATVAAPVNQKTVEPVVGIGLSHHVTLRQRLLHRRGLPIEVIGDSWPFSRLHRGQQLGGHGFERDDVSIGFE
jgi:hypothetical protein